MNAIEFDALPEQRSIHLPEEVPDGVRLRVVLLWEHPGAKEDDLKTLFASTTEGLTDEDLGRPSDLGRDLQWGIGSTPTSGRSFRRANELMPA